MNMVSWLDCTLSTSPKGREKQSLAWALMPYLSLLPFPPLLKFLPLQGTSQALWVGQSRCQ